MTTSTLYQVRLKIKILRMQKLKLSLSKSHSKRYKIIIRVKRNQSKIKDKLKISRSKNLQKSIMTDKINFIASGQKQIILSKSKLLRSLIKQIKVKTHKQINNKGLMTLRNWKTRILSKAKTHKITTTIATTRE